MSIFSKKQIIAGFTLVELMVVISIIGILSTIVYTNFGSAKAMARDNIRQTSLKDMELALRLYKAQNGSYPTAKSTCAPVVATKWYGPGAGTGNNVSCDVYIDGLVPDYIPALPTDPNQESVSNKGFYYKSNGTDYKLMVLDTAEKKVIGNFSDSFARCPAAVTGTCPNVSSIANTYAIYSSGAKDW